MLAVLRNTSFRRLWIGQTASAIGDQLFFVGIVALVVQAGGGAGGVGLVIGARAVALFLFLLAGGVIADRVRRSRVMVGADLVRLVAVVSIAAVSASAGMVQLAALSFVLGCGEALFRPAHQGLIPRLVDQDALQPANAVSSMSAQGAWIAGPALGGALIAAAGVPLVLWLDAATFGISVVTLLLVREPQGGAPVTSATAWSELRDGVRALTRHRWIALTTALRSIQMIFAWGTWYVLFGVVAIESLGGPVAFGWLTALLGLGALFGAVVASRTRKGRRGTVAFAGLLAAVLMFAALIGPSPMVVVALAVLLAGFGQEVFEVLLVSAVQEDVPDRYLSRVLSLENMASLALMPVGALFAVALDGLLGAAGLFAIAAAVQLATAAAGLLSPTIRRFATGPGDANVGFPAALAPYAAVSRRRPRRADAPG